MATAAIVSVTDGMPDPGPYDRPEEPRYYPQKLNKKVRIRPCLGKLHIPMPSGRSEIVFECQEEKHDDGQGHVHNGLVVMNDGTFRSFTLTWTDVGSAKLYRHTQRTKEYRLSQRAAKKVKK